MKKIIILICFLFTNSFVSAKLNIGNKSPGFILSDINGNRISVTAILADNKPIILAYFATWCQPCLKEIPHLQNIQSKSNVKVYLINIDGLNKEKIKEFLTKNNITFPVLLDPEAKITGENFEVLKAGRANIPKLFLISADGIIKYIKDGYDENIEKILAEQITAIEKENLNKPKELAIFFSNSSNGYLESCDCPTHPYGGLVRRATYLKEQRLKNPNNLLFDTGDIFPPYVSPQQAHYLLAMFDALKYDAVAIGDQEFSLDNFVEKIKNYSIPFLSSNVNYCEGDVCSFITPHELVFDKGGIKVAVISTLHPDVFALYPDKIVKKLSIISYKDTIALFIKKHRAIADVLVLLSHSGFDEDKLIAQEFPELDVIIGGHSQTLLGAPYKSGRTLIVQAGENAQNAGILTLTFDKNNKIASHTGEIVPLTKDIADDPALRAMITEFRAKPD